VKRGYWIYGSLGAVAVLVAWTLFVGLPRWYPDNTPPASTAAETGMPTDGEFVDATLFYISDDGMRLVGVERRLARQTDLTDQARVVVEAQLAEPPAPLLSPIPPGTRLLNCYVTDLGDAFVDLSEEVTLGHSGGSLEELFTVYAIVNAVITNLPAINAVQILVNGDEVDTLVGHVDLQRPLERNLQWVADPTAEPPLDRAAPLIERQDVNTNEDEPALATAPVSDIPS
jgi:germination protein M